MGRITRDNLSKSLRELLESGGKNTNMGNVSDLVTTDKTIVGAINEIYQNVGEGKQIISDLIGGDLNSSDAFNVMGDKIEDIVDTLRDYLINTGANINGNEDLNDLLNLLYDVNVIINLKNCKIACGKNHTFILKNDGTVWACGNNDNGQLGLGTTTSTNTFTNTNVNIAE